MKYSDFKAQLDVDQDKFEKELQRALVKSIDVTITTGGVVRQPFEVGSHEVEEWKDHYRCTECNRTPTVTRSLLDEDAERSFKLYAFGYFASNPCDRNT